MQANVFDALNGVFLTELMKNPDALKQLLKEKEVRAVGLFFPNYDVLCCSLIREQLPIITVNNEMFQKIIGDTKVDELSGPDDFYFLAGLNNNVKIRKATLPSASEPVDVVVAAPEAETAAEAEAEKPSSMTEQD